MDAARPSALPREASPIPKQFHYLIVGGKLWASRHRSISRAFVRHR